MPERFVKASEVAEHTGLSVDAVYREQRLGRIPAYRIGRRVRFRLSEVENALKREPQKTTPTP